MLRPLRPCLWPGCPNLTRYPRGCAYHLRQHYETYDAAWDRLAAGYLARHRVCERCRMRRAEHVHHVQPVALAPHRRLDPTNLAAICVHCHRAETPTVRH